MALDTLEIFGTEYTGVKGFKATDDNDGTKAYIRPQGTKSISANGSGIDVAEYAEVDVAVPSATLQTKTKTYTPTESAQSENITADSGYDGLSSVDVSVGAIPSNYVGSGVPLRGSDSMTVSKAMVLAPSGYYPENASKTVTVMTPPSSTDSTASGNLRGTISRSTADQYLNLPEGYLEHASYYKISATRNGTQGTPVATKDPVSNNKIRVTPSVTNTAGYIDGGTQTGQYVEVSASEVVSGSETKTANGTYDVTNLAELVVNVSSGGGGVGTLLATLSLGTISTSSTTAADTGKSVSVSNVNNYDLLIVETSVDTVTNNRHTATVGLIFLTASSTVGTKDGASVATVKWNSKISSSAVTTTRAGTTAYGIYPNSCSVATSNNVTTATIPLYRRYNSTSTGTINGNYTTRVYGVNLYDLIGG